MPRRNLRRRFYRSFHGYGGRHGHRHGAAARIQSAWRRRKRRRVGLTARTALANRRAIKRVNKQIETIVATPEEATLANRYVGSWLQGLEVDNAGQSGGAPFAMNLLYADPLWSNAAGAQTNRPITGYKGRWIQMKSLTLKGCVTAKSDTGAAMYQKTTFILVHDSKPELNPVLVTSTATPNDGLLDPQLPAVVNNRLDTAFYNLNTTGKAGRYKVLKRWTVTVSPHVDLNSGTVPAISTTAGGVAPNVYGNTVRPQYDTTALGLSKKYPPQVYFSHTIKGNYKLNMGGKTSGIRFRIPENQNIFLFAFSTNGPGMTNTSPSIQLVSRFRFKDP